MRAQMSLSLVGAALAVSLLHTASAAAQARPVPQGAPGTVTLPVADYDRLIDRASRPVARVDTPPVAAVAGRAELRARVDVDVIRGTLRIDGEIFQRGAVKVPLVVGATLLDARAGGQPLPVLHESDTHAAIFTGPAVFSVTLDWAAPIGSAPGRASVLLPQPMTSSINAFVDLPGDPSDVRVEPGIITGRQTAAGRTTLELALDRSQRSQVSWSVREASTQTAATLEARTLADVKSLVTIADADTRMVSLVDISVVRGEPRTFTLRAPQGYEITSVAGSSLDTSEVRAGVATVTVREPARRRHSFLLSLEQPHALGSFKAATSFVVVDGVQRETGEVAIEGTGTIEVIAAGDDDLRRMDVREANTALRSLARHPILAAFRYQRRPAETRTLTLDVKRFADAAVIPAAAEHASATTLVTAEGRMLTEVTLKIRNRAQPFMKVRLPPGATMLSVEVAGETAKPVLGTDGTRIPLLRTGFRPDGPYAVSFVYLHAGQALARRGDAHMSLPVIDVPVSVLEWELFLPGQYSAKPIAGNVLPADLVARTTPPSVALVRTGYGIGSGSGGGIGGGAAGGRLSSLPRGLESETASAALNNAQPGQIVGLVTDAHGAVIPGVTMTVTNGRERSTAVTDERGVYVLQGVMVGAVTVAAEVSGFKPSRRTFTYDLRPRRLDFRMEVGELTEAVTVQAEPAYTNVPANTARAQSDRSDDATPQVAPSQNVINLQRRVAGVLPVRVDVPRAGTQYRFMRALVLDEETTVSFRYKPR